MDDLHFGAGKVCTLTKARLVGDTQEDKNADADVNNRTRSNSL